MAGKGEGWGGKGFEHLVVFMSAFAFLFVCLCLFLVLFYWFQCNMKGDEGRRDGKAVEGSGGHRQSHRQHCHLLGRDLISPVLDQFD